MLQEIFWVGNVKERLCRNFFLPALYKYGNMEVMSK